VTISGERILDALRAAWPDVDLAARPRPLTGGYWATILHLRLSGTPDGVPGDVVLRVVPHPEAGAKEIAVQSAVARTGAPTPTVHLTGPAGGPLGDAWAVMDFTSGDPLLAGLDGAATVRRLPGILGRLPIQLAETMAAVHRIDPAPVERDVRAAAPGAALTVDEVVPQIRAGAELTGRRHLVDAVDTLASRTPPQGDAVLCHGDLHPFNLLCAGDRITVLDWTAAVVAPPGYDVAFTRLLLRYPPIAAPPALRTVIDAGARALARRFVRRYRHANPAADLTGLDWYTGLHALRVLVDLATWQDAGDARAEHHPWALVAPGAAAELSSAVGRHRRLGRRLRPVVPRRARQRWLRSGAASDR
jgi:aminoglycoside phosphotransferase (APT) family kinase protein